MAAAEEMIHLVTNIAAAGERPKLYKRDCTQLIRRLRLMLPLLEEVRDMKAAALPEDAFQALLTTTQKAKQLVSLCQGGPKLYLVLEKDALSKRFLEIAKDLATALDRLSLNKLDLSDEVREHVELLHSQLKRAKVSPNAFEGRLRDDVLSVLSTSNADTIDEAALTRLADNLHLRTFADLRKESRAFQKVGMDERIQNILRMLKTIALPENSSIDMSRPGAAQNIDKASSVVIPDDFRCPISLELMKDPVIVATGQTYERASIQKWLDAGRKTCPKTQQVLPHLTLTPNYVLRSLIAQWCEINGVDLLARTGSGRGNKQIYDADISPGERATIELLVQKLSSGQPDLQRAAAGEIRLLAKRSSENRICIAEARAIPLLVNLLCTKDSRTQEHAVTALLNLSIHDDNKATIVMLGAIDPIVEVLKWGSMEARENAAATLFSLSVVDENKVTIGSSGAIPALVDLLRHGTARGKKDAATALFNLSIYAANKARAVRAGVVPQLMNLITDQASGMVDESLAILAILATHQEGRLAIGQAGAVPVLVELIKSGSTRNKENSAAVLHALSSNDGSHLVLAKKLGVYEALVELQQNGTDRAKRKATSILENLSKLSNQQSVEKKRPRSIYSATCDSVSMWFAQTYRTIVFSLYGTLNFTRSAYLKHAAIFNAEDTEVDLTGKSCIVTGANSGLGYATAEALASKGASLFLLCRNKEKGEKAVSQIISKTGNPNISLEVCDLSSLNDIKNFASRFVSSNEPLYALINNAGLMEHERIITSDGMEFNFAVNVAGTYTLTELLIPALEKAAPDSRVITVSSAGMYGTPLIEDLQYSDGKFNGLIQYARNKRLQIAMTERWSDSYKQKGLSFYAMHPGWADTPGVAKSLPSLKRIESKLRTSEQGADTTVWLALQPNSKLKSGEFYFDRNIAPKHLATCGTEYPTERADKIISKVRSLCGLDRI